MSEPGSGVDAGFVDDRNKRRDLSGAVGHGEVSPESQRLLDQVVPPPFQPPALYRAMANNPAVLARYVERPILSRRGLLHTGQLDPADRELCILRVTGRHRAEHEWGVHVAYFGKASGLTPSQVGATVTDDTPDPAWTSRQRAILTIADAVVDVRQLTDKDHELIDASMTPAERTEFVSLSALYSGIAAICRVLNIPNEPGAPAFPSLSSTKMTTERTTP